MRADWTDSGVCTNGSTAPPRGATSMVSGGAATTSIRNESSSAHCLFATLEQPRRFHPIRPCRECRRCTAPAQRLGILKERRIGAQGREILEEQREIALFAEN